MYHFKLNIFSYFSIKRVPLNLANLMIVLQSLAMLLFLNATYGQVSNPVRFVSFSSYIDSIDYFRVVGEVENGSPTVIGFVEVIGTFYDAQNKVVGTSFTYTQL